MDDVPAASASLERKPIDPRGSYISNRNDSKDMKEAKDSRFFRTEQEHRSQANQFKMVVIEPKGLMNVRNSWII